MRNTNLRYFLSAVCLASIWMAFVSSVDAAPVQFNQVVQVINAKPGKANTGSFSSLRLADDPIIVSGGDDDDAPKPQDDRVITETKVEIVEDEVCDCADPFIETKSGGFPKWTLLGLAAVPLVFLVKRDEDPTPTPTPTIPTTQTPTPTTPTPTATPTVTPTPPITPTPTPPEPVPEPVTILLFGTGLAGIGIAARKKFGKKEKRENEE